ncbi:SHOCT domain-containing protein [Halomarina oriensis]|uniref:SHOCT domain-containing protein n=1 Tax=Halomarina oriensis TaxID=671145 RepID=A0A6B0GPV4_9EURY|nr:SHOCT domain-containing protein [Halomarina oriensis]MWG36760.1 hypothetical protein [Halomarina oriensis]
MDWSSAPRTRLLAGVLAAFALTVLLTAPVTLGALGVVGFALFVCVPLSLLLYALRLSRRERSVDGPTDVSEPTGRDPADESPATDDALAELRRRYAAGELSEAQFEGRVERLLADEDDTDDARAVLELRYARGELTDEQFERKRARLDGTDSVEAAENLFDRDPERET